MLKKNYTYYLYLLCIPCLFLMLCADCSNKIEDPQPSLLVEFNNDISVFDWNTQGGYLRINTAANQGWTLRIDFPDEGEEEPNIWCRASIDNGAGDKSVRLELDANYAQEKRVATIFVTLVDATSYSVQLQLEQEGRPGQDQTPDTPPNLTALELPRVVDVEWVFAYSPGEFTLEYAPNKKHSRWVAWKLHRGHLGNSGRTDAWQFDSRIPPEYRPVRQDFSGYDRGHICPSADRTQSKAMNAQTFMYSNMTPQNSNLNQVIWNNLEGKIRGWVSGYDTLYICAGGTVLKEADILGYTSSSSMAIPKYNFKVILRKKASTGAYDAIGFWFENRSYSPQTQVTTTRVKRIREIEALTGIDFFCNLPQSVQDEVENQYNPSAWGI